MTAGGTRPALAAAAATEPAVAINVTGDIPTYVVRWQQHHRPERRAYVGLWIMIGDDDAFTAALAQALSQRGQTVQCVRPANVSSLLERRPLGIVAAGIPPRALFALTQALIDPALPAVRLWLVTIRAVNVGGETEPLNLDTAPIAGFARAFRLEHPRTGGD